MAILASKKRSLFDPAPEGLHNAVCVDVWEPWTENRPEEWGGGLTDKTRICWLIEEINPKTSKPYEVSNIYTLSLHEKANLCKALEGWRGRRFTDEEKRGFDIEKLIGVNCQIQVVHKITADATYANVLAVVPAAKGAPKLLVPEWYVRKKDRTTRQPDDSAVIDTSDDVPF